MAEGVFKHLEKKGIVVPEHQIQPFMSQWNAYKLPTNNSNSAKLVYNKVGHKHVPVEPKLH